LEYKIFEQNENILKKVAGYYRITRQDNSGMGGRLSPEYMAGCYRILYEHNPPHFHAYYQDFKATFNINNCEMIEGNIPGKQKKLIEAWAELHKEELIADWNLAINGENPFKIEPLK
jgi:hypothetical protein